MNKPIKIDNWSIARFMMNVKANGKRRCWDWTGAIPKRGYPMFWKGKSAVRAARFSYTAFCGQLKPGMTVHHICYNIMCVNPRHLKQITGAENTLDSKTNPCAINKRKKECKWGHPFTEENTIWTKGYRGRICRICNVKHQANYQLKRKQARAALAKVKELEK